MVKIISRANPLHSLARSTIQSILQKFGLALVRAEHVAQITKITDMKAIIAEYQFQLERKPDYQSIMAQDQIRAGMTNLNRNFSTSTKSAASTR